MMRTQIPRFLKRVARAVDGFVNPAANLGGGSQGLATNLLAAGTYEFDRLTLNQILLRAAYRGSWIIAKACDGPAEDMTQGGIEPVSEWEPDKWDEIERQAESLSLWPQVADWIRWGRLYGGAILVVGIDGQDPSTPLKPETVGKGQITGFDVFDRWRLIPDTASRIMTPGRNRGLFEHYTVVSDGMGTNYMKIHHSRCLRHEGSPLPHWERLGNLMWGMSVVERIYKVVMAFDSTTTGTAQLATKAHLRTMKIPGLFDAYGGNGISLAAVMRRVQEMRLLQTSEGISVLDETEAMEHFTQTFAGLDGILTQLASQVCGAIEYPEVKLFGKSAAGLNATDEWALDNYNNKVNTNQNSTLRQPVFTLYDLMARHTFGEGLPKDFKFNFKHLSRPNPEKQANVATAKTGAVLQAYEAGLITPKCALLELRQQAADTGLFSNITDEDIDDSENLPPKAELALPDGDEESVGAADASPTPKGSQWITLEDGQHVLIGASGKVISGAGGALNGKYYGTETKKEEKNSEKGLQ